MEEAGSEEKSTFYSVVTHLQPSLSYYSMCIRLPQEVFTLQAKVVRQWVLQFTSREIRRLKS